MKDLSSHHADSATYHSKITKMPVIQIFILHQTVNESECNFICKLLLFESKKLLPANQMVQEWIDPIIVN
jgi:hypothetical protein